MLDTIEFLRELLGQQPESIALRCNLAEELLHEAEYNAAIAEATTAIQQDPATLGAWLTRATAYKKLGRWIEAVDSYKQAAVLAPRSILDRSQCCRLPC